MENLEKILNKEQCEAVRCTEGPLLVLAGAGSGKTRVLTHRVAYLIENCGVAPWNILAITFTNKAAGEMRDRVDQLVGAHAREIWVSTFHSMCVRILRRYIDRLGYKTDFSIYDTDDQRTLMRQVLKELNIDSKMFKERAVLSVISGAKNRGLSPLEFRKEEGSSGDLRMRKMADCFELYEKKLRQNEALDFDDLLLKTAELFETEPEVLQYYQERFRYIMVDEYQDTNDIQFRLVHALAKKYRNLCVVGDDDQSIYAFRGANLENILSFEKSFPGARVIKLEQNYRSTEKILDCANAVIRHNHGRKQKKLWTETKGGPDVRFQEFEGANDEALAVIREVKNCGRPYQDQAILYRTNAQSRLFEEQCIKLSVPYQIIGGVNFYQRKEIKDVLAYMKLIANGADDVAFERIINVPKRGIGDATILKLRMYAEGNSTVEHHITLLEAAERAPMIGITGKAGKKLTEFVELMDGWREKLRKAGYLEEDAEPGEEDSFSIQALIESVRDDTGYGMEIRAEGTIEAETRFQNIEEIISKAADYQSKSDAPKLGEFLEDVSLVADIDRKDDAQDLLTLMTLHGAKGLEFPKVYLVGMNDGLFPGFMSISNPEDLEEERRLCYVGITRAREELVMTGARARMLNGAYERMKPSRFIDEIPDELCDKKMLKSYDDMLDDDDYGDSDIFGGGARRFGAKNGRSGGYGSGGDSSYGGCGAYGSGNRYGGRSGDYSAGGRSGADGGFGANSYGLQGMGSTGYQAGKSAGSATRKKGAGIPKSLMQTGIQKLENLDYVVGDRVKHIKFGEGTVDAIEDGKKDYTVTVTFDTAGQKKMLASFAKLQKV